MTNEQIAAMNHQQLTDWQNRTNSFLTQFGELTEAELQPTLTQLLSEIDKLPELLREELEIQVESEFPDLWDEAKSNTHLDCLRLVRALEIFKERQGDAAKNSLVAA